jgi:hypothetical protein
MNPLSESGFTLMRTASTTPAMILKQLECWPRKSSCSQIPQQYLAATDLQAMVYCAQPKNEPRVPQDLAVIESTLDFG